MTSRDLSLSADNFRKTLKMHLFRNALGHLAQRCCVMCYINLRLTYLLTQKCIFLPYWVKIHSMHPNKTCSLPMSAISTISYRQTTESFNRHNIRCTGPTSSLAALAGVLLRTTETAISATQWAHNSARTLPF